MVSAFEQTAILRRKHTKKVHLDLWLNLLNLLRKLLDLKHHSRKKRLGNSSDFSLIKQYRINIHLLVAIYTNFIWDNKTKPLTLTKKKTKHSTAAS